MGPESREAPVTGTALAQEASGSYLTPEDGSVSPGSRAVSRLSA